MPKMTSPFATLEDQLKNALDTAEMIDAAISQDLRALLRLASAELVRVRKTSKKLKGKELAKVEKKPSAKKASKVADAAVSAGTRKNKNASATAVVANGLAH